jgi:hypothetical protein
MNIAVGKAGRRLHSSIPVPFGYAKKRRKATLIRCAQRWKRAAARYNRSTTVRSPKARYDRTTHRPDHPGRHPGGLACGGRSIRARRRRRAPRHPAAGRHHHEALYTAADLQGLPHTDTLPGFAPFVRGPQATMYAAPVDHPPVRGFLDGGRIQRLPPHPGRRRPGRVRGVRPGHPPRLRFRPSARQGRRRQGRRGGRFGRGHEDPVRRHRSGQSVGFHDHERRRAAGVGRLHRRR